MALPLFAVLIGKRFDMDLLEKMEQLLQDCREDYNKAKGGNKAAGTRVRKAMQDVKNVAQEIRKEMLGSRED
ncbi:MAG: hypothetical protein JKY43_06585 [Phycisphaerales bacterium]|nr:hypothetical protein [Phycisphaerales bacterium]